MLIEYYSVPVTGMDKWYYLAAITYIHNGLQRVVYLGQQLTLSNRLLEDGPIGGSTLPTTDMTSSGSKIKS